MADCALANPACTLLGVLRRFVHESGYAEMETGSTALAFASGQLS
jgi:hypothetical protein